MYGGVESALIGYVDADGSMAEDSYAVSEYIAATHTIKEVLWLHSLIAQLFEPFTEFITLFLDNKSAITLAKDHQFHTCTMHIDIRFHFIC
jgi:hypothetical protein